LVLSAATRVVTHDRKMRSSPDTKARLIETSLFKVNAEASE
jgi:hypothetical protein